MNDRPTDPVYRCVECGHGEHLHAWSNGLMEGPLAADGALERYDFIEDTSICEDSIACRTHGDTALIEKRIGGEWCRVWVCPECSLGEQGTAYFRTRTCFACRGNYWQWRPTAEMAHATN